ncbi:Cytochrome P450 [Mycena venus]|uniref:Cytochrome P450 n=1 Tax=Mycena venus TaxID=2733690 RepID=A0A8H7CN18_9AGAR|nr:Cytochrome P450 [Mycena venus]
MLFNNTLRIEYLFASLLILLAILWRRIISPQRLPLPPGPPRKFITGNLHQLPTSQPWLKYAEWAKEYGPILSLHTFHTRLIILNSFKTTTDLLNSRSAIYSDRPISWMGQLAGRGLTVFQLSSEHPWFPRYRKMLLSALNRRLTQVYCPPHWQEHQLKVLLRGLSESPDGFVGLIKTYVASIALKISYGYEVSADNDFFVTLVEDGSRAMTTLNQPFFYIEIFPFFRFLPSWFPFAKFKRVLKASKKILLDIELVPFRWAKTKIESGTYFESFFSQHFLRDEGHILSEEESEILKWTSGSIYAGGAHTTTSAIASFFLLMSTHPDIQKRAQDEIDRVSGRDRLLTIDDQKALPYVTALLKEILRWAPVAPLGLKHRVTKDDIYNGFWIPKGATIVANIWAIAHDEEVYPNPFAFDPTRYLGESPQRDPFDLVFGYGRRVCPGARLAEDSLFLAVSNILAAFSIYKALDADGKEVEPCVEWKTSVVTFPLNLACRIVPRSPEMLASLAA